MICPCKDCEKKGCGVYHSQCKEYLDYVKWKQSVNEEIRKDKLEYRLTKYYKRRNKWTIKN